MAVTLSNSSNDRLVAGQIAHTLSVKLARSIEISGMAKRAGFDGILIDMEHSSFDLDTTGQLGILLSTQESHQLILDSGALGVIIPHIRTIQDFKDVVDAATFQPIGHRSSTNGLPHFQFRPLPGKEMKVASNNGTLVIPIIETLEALEIVDEIAAVDGVDSLLIGTNELTAEIGIPGDSENPRVVEAYERTIRACINHRKWVGVGGLHAHLDLVEKDCSMGARWVMAATDGPLLLGGATKRGKEMAELNAKIAGSGVNGKVAINGNSDGTTAKNEVNGVHVTPAEAPGATA